MWVRPDPFSERLSMYKIHRYGWTPDKLDHRDLQLFIPSVTRVPLPSSCDLRPSGNVPPVYDQGNLGSCTANAIAAAVDFERKLQGEAFLTPSRLFIYYNERVIEDSVAEDSGAQIRDGIKSVVSQGVCPESEWPYVDDGERFAVQPDPLCYSTALKAKALVYSSVSQDPYFIRHCLSMLGRPVVFGFSVFEAFESDSVAATGKVPLPGSADAPIGGHAVQAVGYNDASQMFLCRNSWGPGWGLEGYFWLPYAYLLNPDLSDDLWVIQSES